MSEEQFDAYVADSLAAIPDPFAEKITEVQIVVEDTPSIRQRKSLGLRPCDALYGLYEGVPLIKRNGMVYAKVPDVITVFRHPMIDVFKNELALKQQIRETVWHEVGHYFGFDHDRINAIKQRLSKEQTDA